MHSRSVIAASAALVVILGCSESSPVYVPAEAPDVELQPGDNNQTPQAVVQPGQACSCDSDCGSTAGLEGLCLQGICMAWSNQACAEPGSKAECPSGSRCWQFDGSPKGICWPDCDAVNCDGTCDEDGSCVPNKTTTANCDYQCSTYCPCQKDSCDSGEACVSGQCVPAQEIGMVPSGPVPQCDDLPPLWCESDENLQCSELNTFLPRTTDYYDDYAINGETEDNQYRSFLRGDLIQLLKHTTAKTYCYSQSWDTGIGGALGLGDMSEANGAIPGTAVNSPGHPQNTHTNGFDIDLAYYQRNTANNRLRPVCDHYSDSQDQHHCTDEPYLLDVWRTALFLGSVFEYPHVRVIGVDGKVGSKIEQAISELCEAGWISATACQNVRLAYEETDKGYGWFHHHHHHAHISISAPANNEKAGVVPRHSAKGGPKMPCHGADDPACH